MPEMATDELVTAQQGRMPTVSIGMPVYNGEKYIREALDSLLAQTFTDFELIISDNASMDGTEAVCREYSARDARIRFARQPKNIGAIANFQFVLDEAKSEYFMWAAYDDRWDRTFIEKLLKIHHYDLECGVAFCDFETVNFINSERRSFSLVPSNARSQYFNYLIRVMQMTPNMIYGLYKTRVIRSIRLEAFYLFDVFVTLAVACHYRIRIANEKLFVAGVTSEHRIPYCVSGKPISYIQFIQKQFILAFRTFGFCRAFMALPLVLFSVAKIKFPSLG